MPRPPAVPLADSFHVTCSKCITEDKTRLRGPQRRGGGNAVIDSMQHAQP